MSKVRSFNVDPWSEKIMAWLLKSTTYRSKAELLIPGVHSLAVGMVRLLEHAEKKDELTPEEVKVLEDGRVLLREFMRRNPGRISTLAGGEK